MIITIQTPNEELLKEFNKEQQGAVRWLQKHFQGTKEGERYCIELGRKCLDEHRDINSKFIDYMPKSGNKWKVFARFKYYAEGTLDIIPCLMMYYETIGSIGIFAPIQLANAESPNDDNNGVLIFTSHFFHRLFNPERDKAANVTLEQALEWVAANITPIAKFNTDNEGRPTIDMRVEGGIARGYRRQDPTDKQVPIFEIRTFLTDSQLNNKQRRQTSDMREMAEGFEYIPMEIIGDVIKNSNDPNQKAEEYLVKEMTMRGMPKEQASSFIHLMGAMVDIVSRCADKQTDVRDITKKMCIYALDWLIENHGKEPTWNDAIRVSLHAGNIEGFPIDYFKAVQFVSTYKSGLDNEVYITKKSPVAFPISPILPHAPHRF